MFLEPDVLFAKPGFSEFHKSSAEKAIFRRFIQHNFLT